MRAGICPALSLFRASALSIFLLATHSAGAAPKVGYIFPAGGRRGETFTMSVSGENLQALRGIFATGTGITAEVVEAGEKEKDEAKSRRRLVVTVAPDAPLGIQELRVWDPTGASNPRFFQIGEWPETREAEPNNTRETAQRLTLPVTVNGQVQDYGDADYYTFHARASEWIACEIYSLRLLGNIGDSWLKGYMEVLDGQGRTLAANEGYYRWDPYIEFQAPADGDYTLLFRELTYRGAPEAVYRLTLGAVPHVTGVTPAGGRPGETVEVRFAGINLGLAALAALFAASHEPRAQ